jgi:iron complex outermembrane recepter protein
MSRFIIDRRRSVAVAVRSVLCAGIAGSALAATPATTPAGEGNSTPLEEVVVTAQFREQSVQDTPLSITAISAAVLESRAQTSIADIANQAPNVTLKPQGAAFGPSLGASIRGVGQFDFNPALEPGVGLYVDDVYFATLTGSILDLLDLERVEILRGPQGTLAGKNSIGGAVRLYSKKPTGSGGSVQATYGVRNRVDLRGSADFAIADNLFARVSGVSKKQDGYVQRRDYGCDNPASGVPVLSPVGQTDCVVGYDSNVNYSAARAQLRWVATDDLEIGASIDYTKDVRNPAGSVLVDVRNITNPNIQPVPGVTNLPLTAFLFPKGVNSNYASYYNPPATFRRLNAATLQPVVPAVTSQALETRPQIGVDFSGWGAAGNIDWKLGERVALQSISAYREYDSYFANDNDLSPLASSLGFGNLAFHSFSQEIRLNGALLDNDRLHYTVGAFYMDQLSVYRTVQDLRYNAVS